MKNIERVWLMSVAHKKEKEIDTVPKTSLGKKSGDSLYQVSFQFGQFRLTFRKGYGHGLEETKHFCV